MSNRENQSIGVYGDKTYWNSSSYRGHMMTNEQHIRVVQEVDASGFRTRWLWLQVVDSDGEQKEILLDNEARAWLIQELLSRPDSVFTYEQEQDDEA